MRLIIAGSRTFTEAATVFTAIQEALSDWFPPDLAPNTVVSEVISGGAHGPDTAGERWAELHGIPVKVFRPDWDEYGRAAGPIRNAEMASYASAGEAGGGLVAVWQRRSAGTASMIRLARVAHLLVHVKEVR